MDILYGGFQRVMKTLKVYQCKWDPEGYSESKVQIGSSKFYIQHRYSDICLPNNSWRFPLRENTSPIYPFLLKWGVQIKIDISIWTKILCFSVTIPIESWYKFPNVFKILIANSSGQNASINIKFLRNAQCVLFDLTGFIFDSQHRLREN